MTIREIKEDPRLDDSCAETIHEVVAETPGVAKVAFDPRVGQVELDYDPLQLSRADVERLAERMGPDVRARFARCTMRVEPRRGRACESCALALEKRLAEIPGVHRATVSYLGGVMSITYDDAIVSPAELAHHVTELGTRLVTERPSAPPEPTWRAWLASDRLAQIFTVVTFVAMLLGWLVERMAGPGVGPIVLYAVAYVTGGYFGLQAGLQSLRERTIDVDLLMVLAAIGAAIVGAPFEGAMLLFLFSLSNVLQTYALDRTRNAIRSLMALRPDEALVRREGEMVTLPIEAIDVGDRIIVRPGERIALDGVVVEGESSVDQSPITGESIPIVRQVGDPVLAGTINQRGGLEVRVSKLARDSTIARLIQLVEEAHSEKAPTQRFIDRAEQYYAAGVIALTVLAILIPIAFLAEPFQTAFYRAMTLMVAASPCALVISTPATVLSAIGNGARRGVLFKGGIYVEQAAGIKVVAFDKTGTLTEGRPQVTDVIPTAEGLTDENLLALAAAVEAKSEHPLAQAVVQAAEARGLKFSEATAFQSATGQGVQALVDDAQIVVGNRRYLTRFGTEAAAALQAVSEAMGRLQDEGKTSVVVGRLDDGHLTVLGIIAIADVLRPNAAAVIRDLKALGVSRVVMLTGDNVRVARAIAFQAGIDDYYAELLPEDKMRLLKELERTYGPVAMVGDGVNDAPALATAAIGMAMGAAGTDVALETADIVLMADDLAKIPYVMALSRRTRRTLVQNLAFALGVIVTLIGAVLGFSLALPLSVIGHEGSTVIVSLNGLRLLGFRKGES